MLRLFVVGIAAKPFRDIFRPHFVTEKTPMDNKSFKNMTFQTAIFTLAHTTFLFVCSYLYLPVYRSNLRF